MRCRQQWDYSSFARQGIAPIVNKPALQLGTLIHAAHAAWIEKPDSDPTQIFAFYAQQELQRIKNQYRHNVGMNISDEELDSTYENIKLGAAMIANYKAHWQTPLPEGFKAIAPEQTILVPIPTYDKGYAAQHLLEMTLDTLLQHERSGLIYVHERKTYGARPGVETLAMSDQFLGYIWGVTQLGIGEVGGIAYDGMWKREKPPKGKTEDDLFMRLLLSREPAELERFGRDLAAQANEMANPNVPIYLNRRWEGCWDCNYARLCVAEVKGEDSEYVRKEYYTARTQTKPAYDDPPVLANDTLTALKGAH